MRAQSPNAGISKFEMAIVLAIISAVAAITLPGLLRSRISANETAAIAMLKSISAAQEFFRKQVEVDTDVDGKGEYGYLQELTGAGNCRTDGGRDKPPANPPYLPSHFGDEASLAGYGLNKGYQYLIYLPMVGGVPMPESENYEGASGSADEQETRYVCYAWPDNYGITGNRCFGVNNRKDVIFAQNRAMDGTGIYEGGLGGPQTGNEAYADLNGNLDGGFVFDGTPAADQQTWALTNE